ncbi:MAG: alpha/beta hydrolase [Gammaproteobacteria bacterium]|nr:alpha/beta hydrolase [Gammaproteobacteria bacterium]MDH5653164.1 alpha/beta hydrolase [Gammaproteobacteria bacterium]
MTEQSSASSITTLPYAEIRGQGEINLVMLHGFTLNRKCWYFVAPELAQQYRLHLIDMMGFGESIAPPGFGFTPREQAEAVADYIEQNNLQRVILIGHSYGGGVALLTELVLQDRGLQDRTEKLVVLAPAIYKQPLPIFVRIPGTPLLGYLMGAMIPARTTTRLTLELTYYDPKLATPAQVDKYVDNMSEPVKARAIRLTARHIIPPDIDTIAGRVEALRKPLLLIYGTHDRIILRSSMERLAASVKGSRYEVLEQCGHVPEEEKPAEVVKLIREFVSG